MSSFRSGSNTMPYSAPSPPTPEPREPWEQIPALDTPAAMPRAYEAAASAEVDPHELPRNIFLASLVTFPSWFFTHPRRWPRSDEADTDAVAAETGTADEHVTCTICQTVIDDLELACFGCSAHIYHAECIWQWWSTRDAYGVYSRSCPNCQQPLFQAEDENVSEYEVEDEVEDEDEVVVVVDADEDSEDEDPDVGRDHGVDVEMAELEELEDEDGLPYPQPQPYVFPSVHPSRSRGRCPVCGVFHPRTDDYGEPVADPIADTEAVPVPDADADTEMADSDTSSQLSDAMTVFSRSRSRSSSPSESVLSDVCGEGDRCPVCENVWRAGEIDMLD
ncbi:uncharacterized protein K452DRAFT_319366 [Aplosporella prunicola CBS 121167]|uniref:RING-type domain-containing protein n=1 Tax=Aplosporella prunicola CBS 121167 TaxID=1176127 RepID=A0A6A6BA99_9PEZI|nr:uncharacterized protein K452DRAFT_319366 [Aplosporella prunicola CBS 121167]KAF2141129.1 hypothetical protein K452DRAFT_319366 [Aplosporella prunicola CBS 121167]